MDAEGWTVLDSHGYPVWVGETEDTCRITIYNDRQQARRALTRVFRATAEAGCGENPMRVGRVRVTVEDKGEPIAPKLRREVW